MQNILHKGKQYPYASWQDDTIDALEVLDISDHFRIGPQRLYRECVLLDGTLDGKHTHHQGRTFD